MSWLSRFSRWAAVRSLAVGLKVGLSATEVRETFDRAHSHQTEEWRREIWREAAERASR